MRGINLYKKRFQWCLGRNPRTGKLNGLPVLVNMNRIFWYHPNAPTKEFDTPEEAVDYAIKKSMGFLGNKRSN